MAKRIKAEDYTHSVWSGEKYSSTQTIETLTAESKKVLRNHPTASKAMTCDDDMMRRLFGAAFKG